MPVTNSYKSRLNSLIAGTLPKSNDIAAGANIPKKEYANGKMLIYHDQTGNDERIEIWPKEDKKIVVIKSVSTVTHVTHFKEIQIMTADDKMLETLTVSGDYGTVLNQTLRIYQGSNYIGSGKGDFTWSLAAKFLHEQFDPRNMANSDIDDDVVNLIQKILDEPSINAPGGVSRF